MAQPNKKFFVQIFLRISSLIVSAFIGLEMGLYIWEQYKYASTSNIKIHDTEQSEHTLILALGDSITQLGYAQILENTKGGAYTLQNAATAGSGIQTVIHILEKNIPMLQGKRHEIVIMTGHNDCRYVQVDNLMTQEQSFQIQTKNWIQNTRSMRFMSLLYANFLDNTYQIETTSPKNLLQCNRVLENGYQKIIEMAQKNRLSIHFMTYPFPKNGMSVSKWNHFMWMSFHINTYIRSISERFNISLIDAEVCMENASRTHWHQDLFHLQRTGSEVHIECIFKKLQITP